MAQENIRAYHSDIAIGADGELTVAETITVQAEGVDIRHGIFRDFPLTMQDADGRKLRVDFDVVSVTRDGAPEDWTTESITGGIRIYAGSKDTVVSRGEHTYVLTYRTDRQIRFFPDHDELYWNVTGNGWQFAMQRASARVTLPGGATPTRLAAYTGPLGATASNAGMSRASGRADFTTTRALGPHDGLTIVVGIPKGVIALPTADQQRAWWLRDNVNLLLGPASLILIFAYYVWFWRRVGRDPPRGIVVPRWDAPEGLSPALVNYVDNKGFSGGGWTAFSASAIDLAVKGQLTLKDFGDTITLERTATSAAATPFATLPAGQSSLMKTVNGAGGRFVIDKANGTAVQKAGEAFRRAIESEHSGKYYRRNIGYIVPGVVLSLAAIFALIVFGDVDPAILPVVIAPAIVAVVFGLMAVRLGRSFRQGASLARRIFAVVALGFIGLTGLSVLSGALLALLSEIDIASQWPVLTCLIGIVLTNAIFFFLMGAPTPLGRKLMDGIEGLRLYLTVAEKDRMNMAGAPDMSPQHFERLLPYAVALGVEKPWSRAFETWLAAATAGAAAAYTAAWYHGDGFGSFGDRIGGFSSGMASTIQSTLPAPTSSSSSGFSGGSSGGGGGGGGGGGW
ncbi:MAG: DUF2207 domain-containing protein [Neorhizobium sp.]|nr:DUF2207 domain-containing protein [Neorhizobium sp.]